MDAVSGDIQIELLGQWLDAFKQMKGLKHAIQTSIYEGHAFAFCMLPNSLFEGN